MRIAVDAMGGDHAPREVVQGAVEAAREHGVELLLAGPEEVLERELARHRTRGLRIHLLPARETIGFDEAPVQALRTKKDSSLVKSLRALRNGDAAAAVSAGSTGALLAGGLMVVGRIRGIDRPALATPLPTRRGPCLLLDVGANADCSPHNLLQFAHMGAIYVERVLGMPDPGVGLLSIGTEEGKGNALTKAAYPLLRDSNLRFLGNVEAREVGDGRAQVIVADGFAGNVLLKTAEGVGMLIFDLIRAEVGRSALTRAFALPLRPALRRVARRLDYSESGGAPFLGIDGALIKCHGSSRARAIRNGVRVARDFARSGAIEAFRELLGRRAPAAASNPTTTREEVPARAE